MKGGVWGTTLGEGGGGAEACIGGIVFIHQCWESAAQQRVVYYMGLFGAFFAGGQHKRDVWSGGHVVSGGGAWKPGESRFVFVALHGSWNFGVLAQVGLHLILL